MGSIMRICNNIPVCLKLKECDFVHTAINLEASHIHRPSMRTPQSTESSLSRSLRMVCALDAECQAPEEDKFNLYGAKIYLIIIQF